MSITLRATPRNPNPQSTPGADDPVDGQYTQGGADTDTNIPADCPCTAEELLERAISDFKASRDHFNSWRQEATSCYDFVASRQWTDEDAGILADQARPAITWNRIGPFVSGVAGLEVGNRQSTQYIPRQVGSSGVNDLLTAAAQWVRDECDAEDEESESFRDVIVCGVGCTQTRMDYDDDPDGRIVIERIDPLEKYPDPSSRKQNYADARFDIRVKDIPTDAAKAMFPDYDAADLHAAWADDQPDDTHQPHNARLAPYYRIDQAGNIDRERQTVRMVEYQWWEYDRAFRVLDPDTGRFFRLSEEKAELYRMRASLLGIKPHMIRDKRKRHWKAVMGAIALKVTPGPDEGGFTDKYMTGYRDRNQGTWYGLVKAMRDPQMWANKWLSQALHIINTNAKGGLLAETDAFVDIQEARDSWAGADSITELNPGGLNKIQQKNPPAFPQQINTMTELAINAIPAVSGVNLEMIAQVSREQPGVLEMQRKQQGMTVLATLFNAKRRYQKEQGRLMLWMIQTFIADGRLIRIGGPENVQYVPLVHQPGIAEYDVIVDDAPTSPNMKERVWAGITQMFPLLRGLPLPPAAWIELMRYSPFPASLVEKMSKLTETPTQPPPVPPDVQARAARDNAMAQEHMSSVALNQTRQQAVSAQSQLDAAATQADIEAKKAGAIANLAKVGLAQSGQELAEAEFAVETLLGAHQQGHDQAMGVEQVRQAAAVPMEGGGGEP